MDAEKVFYLLYVDYVPIEQLTCVIASRVNSVATLYGLWLLTSSEK